MTFYTSRIGDKVNNSEIGRSARSLSSSINCGSCFDLSSRSYNTSKISYRHDDPVAFMESNASLTDASVEDNLNCATMSESRSDIVPPLDLKSEENYSTRRDYTFSYRKHCEGAKIVFKPDKAYETWLSAKRKLLSDEAARRKKEEEMKQREIEERKRLAKEKYDMWLEKKSQTSISLQSITTKPIKTDKNLETRTRPKFTDEEARARLDEWERAKRSKEEHRRMLKRQQEQRRRELEEQRRQMSVEAWNNWVAGSNKKPKPVPLNRGIFTLRGTVSDIFVNPNEWQSITPTNSANQ